MKTTYLKTLFVALALTAVTSVINCAPAEFTQVPKPTGGLEPTHCPGYNPDPQGCLKSRCEGGVANPRVYLTWCSYSDANSNSLQKGDSDLNDPNKFWGWVAPNSNNTGSDFTSDQRDYTDYAVSAGNTYSYRAKFRAETSSNESIITLPIDSCTCGS
ncbi:MAG: hypothetical protein SGI74_06400 [Oligoflexia bacterium]|nr:hypothetical protein [Oligoflexia bacterium]